MSVSGIGYYKLDYLIMNVRFYFFFGCSIGYVWDDGYLVSWVFELV